MSIESVSTFLQSRMDGRVALVSHQRPDGDALGSALGLALTLRRQGCAAVVVNPLPLPEYLMFLWDDDAIAAHDSPDWWRDYDALCVLDCGEASRLDEINRGALEHLPTCTIDHHVTSDGLGEAIWVEAEASSASEMVVRLCRELGWPLPAPAAQALWTGIVTDTGRFSFENATPAALDAARECVMAGADPVAAATELYQSVTWEERRLQAKVLQHMERLEDGRLAVSWLGLDDFKQAGSGVESAQNLINLLRDTAKVEVAVFLYEPPGGGGEAPVKASFRTRSPHDATVVTGRFGGGGHQRAAGCSLPGPMPKALETVLDAVREAFFR